VLYLGLSIEELNMKKIYLLSLVVLTLGLGFMSCQKDTLVTDVPHNEDFDPRWGKGQPIPIVAPFYFEGKIDSTHYVMQDSIAGYLNYVFDAGYAACDADGNGKGVFYGQLTGMYTLGGTQSLEIKFLKCVEDSSDVDDKKSLIFEGTYSYGSSSKFSPVEGVEITWVDKSNKVWKSLPGSGAKSNNSFYITNISPAPSGVLGNLKIEGRMDVTLYNATKSIRIEGGVFEFQYGVY